MNIEQSRNRIEKTYQWRIHGDTFQVLDQERCLWVAQVTTTFLHERDQDEETFPILVEHSHACVLPHPVLPTLGKWCLSQKASE